MPLPEQQRDILLDVAWQSIRHGLQHGTALPLTPDRYESPLCDPGASFVTLHSSAQLRGCIGTLEAFRALVSDVSENAFAAAFRDPRFTPLRASELKELSLNISLLSTPEALSFASQQELLTLLRPGVDGLILQANGKRGTFLPTVWESLPEPQQFLQHLKLKAGLPADYWSDAVRIWRYTTECFGTADPAQSATG